ncbi:Oidioi.mRNA.OKI2018_I69.XSR.g16960.t1.cds [Oikopleura dioica]|uniref:Anaphase-promoting complex subunit 11 n=1 Tax=Oikopleura dioica TaxID=34765 RepID=A0ABN7SMF3_OIKDI|nr:Oidioi.mRNA.OKI2018_I69.XSR.g16960.t1.cds [Oikopleura dioica]
MISYFRFMMQGALSREVAAPRALLAREDDAQNNNDDAQIMSLNAQLVEAESDADKLRSQLWAERLKHNHEIQSLKETFETEMRIKDAQIEEAHQKTMSLQYALLDVSKIEQEVERAKDINDALEEELLIYTQHIKDVEARVNRTPSPIPQSRVDEDDDDDERSEDNMEVHQDDRKKCSIIVDFEATCNTGICKFPGDDCPVIRGGCKHPFHLHCINKWLTSQEENRQEKVCPLCRQVWSYKNEEEDKTETMTGEAETAENGTPQFVLPTPIFNDDD